MAERDTQRDTERLLLRPPSSSLQKPVVPTAWDDDLDEGAKKKVNGSLKFLQRLFFGIFLYLSWRLRREVVSLMAVVGCTTTVTRRRCSVSEWDSSVRLVECVGEIAMSSNINGGSSCLSAGCCSAFCSTDCFWYSRYISVGKLMMNSRTFQDQTANFWGRICIFIINTHSNVKNVWPKICEAVWVYLIGLMHFQRCWLV